MTSIQTAADDQDVSDCERLSDRDVRALTEHMDIYRDDPEASSEEVAVYNKGSRYLVNPRARYCDCDDQHYRQPEGGCKHLRRLDFADGRRDIPQWVQTDALDDGLNAAEAASAEAATVAVADGGRLYDDCPKERYETEEVDCGYLVWDTYIDNPGKRLAGFTLVTDWDAMRSELAGRGLDVGDIHHKQVFSPTEVGL